MLRELALSEVARPAVLQARLQEMLHGAPACQLRTLSVAAAAAGPLVAGSCGSFWRDLLRQMRALERLDLAGVQCYLRDGTGLWGAIAQLRGAAPRGLGSRWGLWAMRWARSGGCGGWAGLAVVGAVIEGSACSAI